MKPNLFEFSQDCPEEFFSKSLAYVMNLFPDIGQEVVCILAARAGMPADCFGTFERCEFVGHSFPDGHRLSRPDLRIHCSKHTIYFENKLESRLDLIQMQRHHSFTCKESSCSLVLVSNIYDASSNLRSLGEGYLHPRDRDHFLWLDLVPAFDGEQRRGLAAEVINDFRVALKANGMIGRNIDGATGSLYTHQSEACHLALRQLLDVLKEVGFKAQKPQHETTIRAYPVKHRQYPLLNPRFWPTAAVLDEAGEGTWDKECLVFTVISKGDRSVLDTQLRQFASSEQCAFFPDRFERIGLHYLGFFVLPLTFSGNGPNSKIEFSRLREPLGKMLRFLSRLQIQ